MAAEGNVTGDKLRKRSFERERLGVWPTEDAGIAFIRQHSTKEVLHLYRRKSFPGYFLVFEAWISRSATWTVATDGTRRTSFNCTGAGWREKLHCPVRYLLIRHPHHESVIVERSRAGHDHSRRPPLPRQAPLPGSTVALVSFLYFERALLPKALLDVVARLELPEPRLDSDRLATLLWQFRTGRVAVDCGDGEHAELFGTADRALKALLEEEERKGPSKEQWVIIHHLYRERKVKPKKIAEILRRLGVPGQAYTRETLSKLFERLRGKGWPESEAKISEETIAEIDSAMAAMAEEREAREKQKRLERAHRLKEGKKEAAMREASDVVSQPAETETAEEGAENQVEQENAPIQKADNVSIQRSVKVSKSSGIESGFLIDESKIGPKPKGSSEAECHKCLGPMRLVLRRNRRAPPYPALRCKTKRCQTWRSLKRMGTVAEEFRRLEDSLVQDARPEAPPSSLDSPDSPDSLDTEELSETLLSDQPLCDEAPDESLVEDVQVAPTDSLPTGRESLSPPPEDELVETKPAAASDERLTVRFRLPSDAPGDPPLAVRLKTRSLTLDAFRLLLPTHFRDADAFGCYFDCVDEAGERMRLLEEEGGEEVPRLSPRIVAATVLPK